LITTGPVDFFAGALRFRVGAGVAVRTGGGVALATRRLAARLMLNGAGMVPGVGPVGVFLMTFGAGAAGALAGALAVAFAVFLGAERAFLAAALVFLDVLVVAIAHILASAGFGIKQHPASCCHK
jgi:hypothetical protein